VREIKFRAWDRRTSQLFTVGSPWEFWDDGAVAEHEGSSIFDSNGLFNRGDFELTEYTGLKDKNGVKIFEGDIVRGVVSHDPQHVCEGLKLTGMVGKEAVGKIEYGSLYAQFYFTTDEITYLDLCLGLREIEVIGNIHQHPELLDADAAA
jgi:uncharacterized phage protein (TIGR01671 family)